MGPDVNSRTIGALALESMARGPGYVPYKSRVHDFLHKRTADNSRGYEPTFQGRGQAESTCLNEPHT